MRGARVWASVDALSADAKRTLEEACLATTQALNQEAAAYSVTPLLTDVVSLVREAPDIIQVNLFDLKSGDFESFALWLDVVERMGRDRYLRVRDDARKLSSLPAPVEDIEEEEDEKFD